MDIGTKMLTLFGVFAFLIVLTALILGNPEVNPANFKREGATSYTNKFVAENFCGTSTKAACSFEYECVTGGCSNEVCQGKNEKPAITTCEVKECYDPVLYDIRCGCFEGKCQWARQA